MNKKIFFLFFLLLGKLTAAPPPLPSAGIVEREIEKEYEGAPLPPRREIPAIEIDIPKETLELPSGKSVFIQEIQIEGNTSISSKELISQLSEYLEKDLMLQDIYQICFIIEQYYAQKGYFLARSYPPPQSIEKGVLRIEVIEGCLGRIKVEGNKHYTESFVRSYFTRLVNKPLQYDQFFRALMLLNDNTDLVAAAVFEKGEEFGCADVIIKVQDARPSHLYLNANNYGRDLTTNVRAGPRLDLGNLFTQGDTFSVTEVVGFPFNALYFTDASYKVPVNRRGTSLQASYLFSDFKIEELTSLRLKGISNIATLKVNQALVRKRSLSLDLFSYFDYKQIQNLVLNERVSFDKLRVLTVGSLLDHSSAKGRDYLILRFAAGIPNLLGGLRAVDSLSSRKGGGGRFFILTADYDHIQQLPKDCFFYFHGSAQASPNKLTLPEQMYIGGADTVRGYPLAVGLGDNGYYFNFELRVPPPVFGNKEFRCCNKKWKDILQFDVFLDHGGVSLHSEQSTYLWGTGLGIKVKGPYTLNLSFDVGFPLNRWGLTKDAFYYFKLTGQPF
jgi:hemolysin activation/secretion protein